MKRFFLLIIISSFFIPCALSIPLEEIISDDSIKQIRALERGRIMEVQFKNPKPVLLPNTGELGQFITGTIGELKPNMMVETLYLYLKPEKLRSDEGNWDEEQKINVFNQMMAISSLTGIEYYSASRGSMRTFYEYSGIIDGPQTKKPLPDPVYTQIPAALSIYAKQKDLTFGDNIYRYSFTISRDSIFFVQENITALNYGVIPVIGKSNLRSFFAVIDCGDTILVYAASMAKTLSVPGLFDRIGNSFSNRAEAVLNWFNSRLENGL